MDKSFFCVKELESSVEESVALSSVPFVSAFLSSSATSSLRTWYVTFEDAPEEILLLEEVEFSERYLPDERRSSVW